MPLPKGVSHETCHLALRPPSPSQRPLPVCQSLWRLHHFKFSKAAGKERATAGNGAALKAAAAGERGGDVGEAAEADAASLVFVLRRRFFAGGSVVESSVPGALEATGMGVPTMRKEGSLFLALRISRATLCHFTAWGHTRSTRELDAYNSIRTLRARGVVAVSVGARDMCRSLFVQGRPVSTVERRHRLQLAKRRPVGKETLHLFAATSLDANETKLRTIVLPRSAS